MLVAGLQSFRAQHSSGYQSCACTGAHPKIMPAKPATAAHASGV